jgi:photosystem II stability/assembly factor-like uncharacterized protein
MKKLLIVGIPLCFLLLAFFSSCKPDNDDNPAASGSGGFAWEALNGPLDTNLHSAKVVQVMVGAGDKLYAVTNTNLYSSTDGGATWQTLNYPYYVPLSSNRYNANSQPFSLSPNGMLFANITDSANLTYATYRSTDGGMTWGLLHPPVGTNYYGTAFAPDGTVYITGGGNLYSSSDNGTTWSASLLHDTVLFLQADANGYLYACTYDKGLLRSKNNGASWQAINAGLGTFPDPKNKLPCVLGESPNGELYASIIYEDLIDLYGGEPYGGGLFRSSDNGDTWQQINNGISVTAMVTELLYLKNNGAIAIPVNLGEAVPYYISTDGTTWQTLNIGINPYILWLALDSKQYLYAVGGDYAIYKTVNPVD